MVDESIISIVLTITGILIIILIPILLKEDFRIFAIALILIIFLLIFLNRFNRELEGSNKRIENTNKRINDLNKRFKTLEELNGIRLNIKELQKEIFKNRHKSNIK